MTETTASNVIKLSKPITEGETELKELVFATPTTEDVMAMGLPHLMVPGADGDSVGVEVRTKVVGAYIAKLAKIPPSSVKQLTIADFNACTSMVMGFFNSGA